MLSEEVVKEFQSLVLSENNSVAELKLNNLKIQMLDMDSLPPLNINTPNSAVERQLAKQIWEYAVILSINQGEKDKFSRNISCLKSYYANTNENEETDIMCNILGLNLLFLLVENRLADFHCELELLSQRVLAHPAVTFCTQLDKHLVVGSYDQVLVAAANPPVKYYSFFLASLLETVRINVGECVAAAYKSLTVSAATKMLMFESDEATLEFIAESYPDWTVSGGLVTLAASSKAARSEEISSVRLITQNLSYATELERIV